MECKIIFSCQADFGDIAVRELMDIYAPLKFIKWIDGGAGLLEYNGKIADGNNTDGTFAEFSALVRARPPIFTRHIFPAEYIVPYAELAERSRIGEFAFAGDILSRMDKEKDFSVQVRAAKDNRLCNPLSIKIDIADYFKSEGFTESKRYPEQVISVYVAGEAAYIGFSRADENLSIWSGGMRHYAVREDTISRAEFKLMEALEAYPVKFNENSTALDLGAAPGGWTKVLTENGFRVTAVDSVRLSPALLANKNVSFFNGRVRDYIKSIEKSSKTFDLIVNDMSMNIVSSINFILSLKNRLRKNGYIIFTLKLRKHDGLNEIKEAIKILGGEYDVVLVKQFFHNRSEITIILQNRLQTNETKYAVSKNIYQKR